ncbi:hypothetical protein FOA52_012723 [Chlamydomonas sp. UWO 241]|nr:hypothetical protein FOA52_012723 [Chlamydomonas sp. UWO 241]
MYTLARTTHWMWHHVLTCPHTNGLSAHRGFFGSRHFSKANALLQEGGQAAIEWCCTFYFYFLMYYIKATHYADA